MCEQGTGQVAFGFTTACAPMLAPNIPDLSRPNPDLAHFDRHFHCKRPVNLTTRLPATLSLLKSRAAGRYRIVGGNRPSSNRGIRRSGSRIGIPRTPGSVEFSQPRWMRFFEDAKTVFIFGAERGATQLKQEQTCRGEEYHATDDD
jgi:hypothetical protein